MFDSINIFFDIRWINYDIESCEEFDVRLFSFLFIFNGYIFIGIDSIIMYYMGL